MTRQSKQPTLDQVLSLVERLPLADQARLVEQVLPRLMHALTAESTAIEPSDRDVADPDTFADLIELGQRLARDWPSGVTSADILSTMRDKR